ncbi:hypothetical protein RRF57_010434 [Xylaria bambusicola]|uniref:Uncharacterized protein n=1 Tax=Xylaria bambusicola TaxID=326684 RepID=A0AAN7UY68_9PEZI
MRFFVAAELLGSLVPLGFKLLETSDHPGLAFHSRQLLLQEMKLFLKLRNVLERLAWDVGSLTFSPARPLIPAAFSVPSVISIAINYYSLYRLVFDSRWICWRLSGSGPLFSFKVV